MADSGTPEDVAYRLLLLIGQAEGKGIVGSVRTEPADRAWVLTTYSECLRVVKGVRPVVNTPPA